MTEGLCVHCAILWYWLKSLPTRVSARCPRCGCGLQRPAEYPRLTGRAKRELLE